MNTYGPYSESDLKKITEILERYRIVFNFHHSDEQLKLNNEIYAKTSTPLSNPLGFSKYSDFDERVFFIEIANDKIEIPEELEKFGIFPPAEEPAKEDFLPPQNYSNHLKRNSNIHSFPLLAIITFIGVVICAWYVFYH